jgi:hypothetical protein
MRELHGVVFAGHPTLELKHRALLFDKFHVWDFDDEKVLRSSEFRAELDFLRSQHIVVDAPPFKKSNFSDSVDIELFKSQLIQLQILRGDSSEDERVENTLTVVRDALCRTLATRTIQAHGIDLVPLCEVALPEMLPASPERSTNLAITTIANVTLPCLPVPDDSCAWQDIIEFKSGLKDKQWGFRRFLETLTTKKQTEPEIRDEIEWMVNEYTKAMEIHRIKASQRERRRIGNSTLYLGAVHR